MAPIWGRRPRLRNAVDLDKAVAVTVVRVVDGFRHAQDRREADVGLLHDLGPFGAGLALEDALEALLHLRPMRAVGLRRQVFAFEAGVLQQERIELRLDRADRDIFAVLCLVHLVVMRGATWAVLAARCLPATTRPR